MVASVPPSVSKGVVHDTRVKDTVSEGDRGGASPTRKLRDTSSPEPTRVDGQICRDSSRGGICDPVPTTVQTSKGCVPLSFSPRRNPSEWRSPRNLRLWGLLSFCSVNFTYPSLLYSAPLWTEDLINVNLQSTGPNKGTSFLFFTSVPYSPLFYFILRVTGWIENLHENKHVCIPLTLSPFLPYTFDWLSTSSPVSNLHV